MSAEIGVLCAPIQRASQAPGQASVLDPPRSLTQQSPSPARACRTASRRGLPLHCFARARVAELVDAADLKSAGFAAVPVRFRPRAPFEQARVEPCRATSDRRIDMVTAACRREIPNRARRSSPTDHPSPVCMQRTAGGARCRRPLADRRRHRLSRYAPGGE